MPFGWEGQKVRLVPLDKDRHFDNCVRWLNDPEVTEWTLIGDFPLSRLTEEEYFERLTRKNEIDVAFAIETLEEEHLGVCSIHNINQRHGFGTLGLLIGRRPLWRRGYGSDTIAVLIRYGFEVLGLRLILADAFANNTASLRALQKSGFHEIGRIPARYWKRGAYRDDVNLMLSREEWAARAAGPGA